MDLDTLVNYLPPKYMALAVALLAFLRALDGIIRLIPDKYLAAHTTTQAVILLARKLLGSKAAPPALLIAVLLLPRVALATQADPYHAMAQQPDGSMRVALVDNAPTAPADVKAQPAPTPEPKKLPTMAEVAACTLSAVPGLVTDCIVGGNYKGPAVDSRVFWTTLGVGAGNSILAIGAFLAAHYIPVSNDKATP